MVDADDVFRIALALPETTREEAGVSVAGKGFVWFWRERVTPNKARVQRHDVVAIYVSGEGEKQALLAADPEKFFTEPHYNGYPAVLVRLAAIDTEELTELLTDAWRLRATKKLVAMLDAAIMPPVSVKPQ